MLSFLSKTLLVSASLLAFELAATAQVPNCRGCVANAATNPASGSTGLVPSCAGRIELRLTVTPTDGKCTGTDLGTCVTSTRCDFKLALDYRAIGCTGGRAVIGVASNNCGVPFTFAPGYAMSFPGYANAMQKRVLLDCGTGCSVSFFGQCVGTCNAAIVGATLDCAPCQIL